MKMNAHLTNAFRITPALSEKRRRGFRVPAFFISILLFLNLISPALVLAVNSNDATDPVNENVLPAITCHDPVYYAETDSIIAASDSASSQLYLEIRNGYGLKTPAGRKELDRLALYAAMAALGNGSDKNEADGQVGTDRARGSIGEAVSSAGIACDYAYTYFTDYTCVDAGKAAGLALNSIVNTPSGFDIVTSPGTVSFGMASAIRRTASGCEYCFVICTTSVSLSETKYAELDGKLPEIMCISGELDGTPCRESQLVLGKGGKLSTEQAAEACGIRGLRGDIPDVRFDQSAVNTSVSGTYDLNIAATLGGRIEGKVVSVQVNSAPSTSGADLLLSDGLELPPVPEGEIWDVSLYVRSLLKQYDADITLLCSPQLIGTDALPKKDTAPETETPSDEAAVTDDSLPVTVMIIDAAGHVSNAGLRISLGSGEYEPVRPVYTDNKGLNVMTGEAASLSEGCHSVISWEGKGGDGSADTVYIFSSLNEDGPVRSVRKNTPYSVWVPQETGIITVTALEIDARSGNAETAMIRVDVAERKVFTEYVDPAADIDASLRIQELENGEKLVFGFKPGTSASSISGSFTVSGGDSPVLSVYSAAGTLLDENGAAGTGAVVTLTDGDKEFDRFVIIISGDTNGDGSVGIADFAKLRQHLLKGGIISDYFVYAADLNGDGSLGIGDFAKLRQYLLGTIELN